MLLWFKIFGKAGFGVVLRSFESRPIQYRSRELRTLELGRATDIVSAQVRISQVRIRQVRLLQVGTLKLDSFEVNA